MKGDCGIRAISAVTGTPFNDVKDMFVQRFGKTHILGPDMRQLLSGWRWTHNYGMPVSAVPAEGKVVVVTRRGFYAVIDGEPQAAIPGDHLRVLPGGDSVRDDYRRGLLDNDGLPLPPILTSEAAQRRVRIAELEREQEIDRKEYNCAVANGLIIRARSINRRMNSREQKIAKEKR